MTEDTQLWMTREESRQIDQAAVRELGLTGLLLMENAARAACDAILRMSITGNITIVCGPGNNGGDGFALARQLASVGEIPQVVLMTADKELADDTSFNRGVWLAAGFDVLHADKSGQPREAVGELGENDLIVDCLLGTGIRGAARPPFSEFIAAINSSAARVLAIDVPSGLDCETGAAAGEVVQANQTVTFVGMKVGYWNAAAKRFTGTIEVAPIGIPDKWVRDWLQRYRSSAS